MSDNFAISTGASVNIATDEIGGAHYPRVKVTWGADGTANDASATNPVPAQLYASGAAVSPATSGRQDTGNTALSSISTTLSSMAADTSTTNVAQDTAVIKNGATSLTPKFAPISSTGSGDTVAAVTGKKIRVLSLFLVVAGATTVKFQSGGSSDRTGAMPYAANGGISLPFNPVGWFETVSGDKLNHVLSSGTAAVAGGLTYVEV